MNEQNNLKKTIAEFIDDYKHHDSQNDYLYNYTRTRSQISQLAVSIRHEEIGGKTKESIFEDLIEVRKIMTESPFLNRMQNWPEGYVGDYLTIEDLYWGVNQSVFNTYAYFIEEYGIRSPVAQQHRNKVQHQSDLLLRSIVSADDAPNILSIGCGGSIDARLILDLIQDYPFTLVLNDMDNNALEFSRRHLGKIENKCHYVNENIVRSRQISSFAPYDLVITGGVFDYLVDKSITFILKYFKNSLLRKGGKFFFTNIKKGNPIRIEIEYFGTWELIERDEEDIKSLCNTAGFTDEEVNISLDSTGLTYLVELTNS